MKSLIEFIKENITESQVKFDIDDIASVIKYSCHGDYWKLGTSATSRKGTLADAVNAVGSLCDVLKFHDAFKMLADDLDCDEEKLIEFISDNEDELMKKMGFK